MAINCLMHESQHSCFQGICSDWAFLGTITIGPGKGETLWEVIPAFSSISNSSQTHWVCFHDKVKAFHAMGDDLLYQCP